MSTQLEGTEAERTTDERTDEERASDREQERAYERDQKAELERADETVELEIYRHDPDVKKPDPHYDRFATRSTAG